MDFATSSDDSSAETLRTHSSMILAVADDGPYRGLIGVGRRLPWQLPRVVAAGSSADPEEMILTDSQFLRDVTMRHHHIIAGRGSVPRCGYPGREVHFASRSAGQSVEKLLQEYPGGIVCGGVDIYHAAAPIVDVLYITRVSGFSFDNAASADKIPPINELKCVDLDMIMSHFPILDSSIPLVGVNGLTVVAEVRLPSAL